MSSENGASQAFPSEEGPCNNQNQMKTKIGAEVLQCQKYQEEIVQKINQSKKALHQEEKCVLHHSKKIKEIDASIAASSKILEQETYKRWKLTQNLSNVRNLCQDVNTISGRTEDILNRCEQDIVGYEKQVISVQGVLEERKSRIDGKLEAQRPKLQELEAGNEKDKKRYESEKENLLEKISEIKQQTQTEIQALPELRSRLDRAQERKEQIRTQIAIANAENTQLQNKSLEKQERKQSVLASIEKNRGHYNTKINEMKSTSEDKQSKLQQITEENETVVKELEEESNRRENILSDISEYSQQLDHYKQKCLETETAGKQGEERFIQEHDKAESKAQDLTNSLSTLKQKLSEDKNVKAHLESEMTAMIEEIQRGLTNIERLKSETLKLQSLNEIKAKEVSEITLSIDVTTGNIVKISNDFMDLTKKFNEKEMKRSQQLMKITGEIQELEKQIEEVKDAENAKLNKIREEMERYRIKAGENLLKQQERDQEIAKHFALRDELKKEHESVVNNIKQFENDLQGVTLEHDILLKKVEETRRSNLTGQKWDKIFERPRTFSKREMDEMSDSSMEGMISVQEHIKRQKLRAHKTSATQGKQT